MAMNIDNVRVGKGLIFVALALSLAACGGGSSDSGSSSSNSSSSSSSTDSSTPASTTVAFNAYSSIGATSSVPLSFTTAAGATTATVTGANLSTTTTITSYDAQGNATAISGGFTKVIAFGGDIVGQVCDNVAGHAYYSFVLDSATEVPVSELAGKSFTSYENCAAINETVTFNADGTATMSNGTDSETVPAATISATFSSTGDGTPDGFQNNAKAYKTTVNGAAYYAVILTGRKIGSEATTGFTDLMVLVP